MNLVELAQRIRAARMAKGMTLDSLYFDAETEHRPTEACGCRSRCAGGGGCRAAA